MVRIRESIDSSWMWIRETSARRGRINVDGEIDILGENNDNGMGVIVVAEYLLHLDVLRRRVHRAKFDVASSGRDCSTVDVLRTESDMLVRPDTASCNAVDPNAKTPPTRDDPQNLQTRQGACVLT